MLILCISLILRMSYPNNNTYNQNFIFSHITIINDKQLKIRKGKNNTFKDKDNYEVPFDEIKIYIEKVYKEINNENIVLPQFTYYDLYQALFNKKIKNSSGNIFKRYSLIQPFEKLENNNNYLITIKGRNIKVNEGENNIENKIKNGIKILKFFLISLIIIR